MAYTTIKKPSDYFNTNLYTGNNTETSHTVGFQPDLTWLKVRNASGAHYLFDAVRGATNYIRSDNTAGEGTSAETLKSFDANGYTVGTANAVNTTNETMVGWNWLGANGTASNTDGTITSTVSANTTSGFSIVSYTGTGANATVGHGLGATPKLVIFKNRSGTNSWRTQTTVIDGSHDSLYLNLTDTAVSAPNSAPTSTILNLDTGNEVNGSGSNFIAYCFAEKQGFSKIGSYTGNGSTDGTFVYTGFKPAFVIQKNASAVQGWQLQDNKRLGYNPNNYLLQPHDSAAESALQRIDLLSNGFKVRTTDAGQNASGNTYIYMAFAEEPLVGDNPATAR